MAPRTLPRQGKENITALSGPRRRDGGMGGGGGSREETAFSIMTGAQQVYVDKGGCSGRGRENNGRGKRGGSGKGWWAVGDQGRGLQTGYMKGTERKRGRGSSAGNKKFQLNHQDPCWEGWARTLGKREKKKSLALN